jgi:hypothetical protein
MPRGRKNRSEDVLLRSAEMVGWALGGLEREIEQTKARLTALNAQAAKLRARAGVAVRTAAIVAADAGEAAARQTRRQMTAEGRKRISEMMKKRWAEAKKKNRTRL